MKQSDEMHRYRQEDGGAFFMADQDDDDEIVDDQLSTKSDRKATPLSTKSEPVEESPKQPNHAVNVVYKSTVNEDVQRFMCEQKSDNQNDALLYRMKVSAFSSLRDGYMRTFTRC